MSVIIIDYGSGNLRSVSKAFEAAANHGGLNFQVEVTNDPDRLRKADRVVLPGVGAFADCKAGLDAIDGMHEALDEVVLKGAKPFFGICVGMQLMAERGLEHGETEGLGWIGGDVVALKPSDKSLKIPHMGWNDLNITDADHPLFKGLKPASHAYFVHSYHFRASNPDHVLANVDYGGPVTAAIGRDTLIGTQFHPEKSQATGLAIIENFLKWKP